MHGRASVENQRVDGELVLGGHQERLGGDMGLTLVESLGRDDDRVSMGPGHEGIAAGHGLVG